MPFMHDCKSYIILKSTKFLNKWFRSTVKTLLHESGARIDESCNDESCSHKLALSISVSELVTLWLSYEYYGLIR